MKKLISTLTLALGVTLLGAACEVPEESAPPVQGGESSSKAEGGETKKAAKPPIGLKARATTAQPSVLSSGGPLTCVAVTVTNNSKKKIAVNPLYFAITGTDGTKRDAATALGEYEGQIDTMDLAPGENAKGKVCVKGKFKPAQVSMTNELLSTAARAKVQQ